MRRGRHRGARPSARLLRGAAPQPTCSSSQRGAAARDPCRRGRGRWPQHRAGAPGVRGRCMVLGVGKR
eukprot:scaffold89585_cov57-Phaeocystis_antarctica.AAC.3